ncbi:PREDICTED: probable disease resistance RPP8-like protein 2 [Nicotiana attenuata]|uniref:Disease resistance rpp8-like protein 2 n=1 Tax=Nicotiana attenuata TaxID=49451 RepID=A0A314LBI6_NICAT|nr:PREDICTED: probable disease resistance RPP8-like protein 2 [Nicotiana attenuata]OIT38419.1 putative disease resistance rpp8-like protein 2 [Nicotiana attenuata]
MYDSPLFFLLEILYESLKKEAEFLLNVPNQVQNIRAELNRIQCFLHDADAKKPEYETVRNWIADIREVAYDVENILEKYTHKIVLRKDRSIWKENIAIHNIGMETKDVMSRIDNIRRCMKTYVDIGIRTLGQGESSNSAAYEKSQWLTRSYSHLIDEDFVGLEEEVNKLVVELINEENDEFHGVFAICGMGGIGKTTLARKAYRHIYVQGHFQAFAWASISKQWQARDVLQRILTKLEPENRTQINMMMDDELVKELYTLQQSKKCLIVLDDIWSTNFWNSVRHAFPKGKGCSKIMLTTRKKDVCTHVDPTCFFFEPRCLDAEESWKLLHRKAFPRVNTPDLKIDLELERLGKEMVSECGGLPLAIIVLAGLLARRPKVDEWRRTRQNLNSHMSGESFEQDGGIHGVLALSYYDLPYQLKPCFLYLGNFPEDQKISARRLYQLWAAEGIISLEGEETEMMELGQYYLQELAQRYMVEVQLEETNGRIKSCRLHDLMRDTCLSKAKEENFLKTVSHQHCHKSMCCSSSAKAISTRAIRRLSITVDNDVQSYFSTNDKSFQHVRSAMFFPRRQTGGEGTAYPLPIFQGLCNNFTMLRVLHLEKFSFEDNLPKAIGNFVHLRYLSFRHSHFQRLPSSIGNLKYLQTLDLRVNFFSYLTMPNTIQKLKNLRNLYLPPSHQNTYKLQLSSLNQLDMLKNFDTQVSPFRDLFKLTKLQKLGAVFSLEFDEMEEIITHYLTLKTVSLKETSFRVYYRFHSEKELNILKLLIGCNHLRKLDLIGHISKLPEHHFFSQNLTKLTLRRSGLEEDPMLILQKLPKLFTLSLRGSAFIGKEMRCSSQGFPLLKTLQIQGLPNLESWRVETGAMPNLVHLEIDGCKKLEKVPDGLVCLTKLQEIIIIDMPETFQTRLQEIQGEEFYKVRFRKFFDMKKFPKTKPKMLLSGQIFGGLLQTIYPSTVPKEWKMP